MKKICSKCHKTKKISEFYKDSTNKDGHTYQCKECNKAYQVIQKRKVRLDALEALGGKCIKCGFSDWRALQIDHIDGMGKLERGREYSIQVKIIKNPKESKKRYQLLCSNCNWIKRYEKNEAGGRGNKTV